MKSVNQCSGWPTILGSLTLLVLAGTSLAQGVVVDLTGTWYDKDSVTYIRQVGSDVWWMQKSLGDGGKGYTNVFKGKLDGNKLTGQWADVPAGKERNHGKITADVVVKGGKVTAIDVEIFMGSSKKGDRFRLTHNKPK